MSDAKQDQNRFESWLDDDVELVDGTAHLSTVRSHTEQRGQIDVPPMDTPAVDDYRSWLTPTSTHDLELAARSGAEHDGSAPERFDTNAQFTAMKAEFAEKTRTDRARRRRRSRIVVAAAGGGVVIALVAAGVLLLGSTDNEVGTVAVPTIAAPPPASTTAAPTSAPAAAKCPEVSDGARISGDGPGDTSTATGVIFYAQYQMYVARNADAARTVFAPGAAVAPVDATRAAIAAIPQGVTHCVRILTVSPTEYAVSVDEYHPDGTQQTWDNRFLVAPQPDGRQLITAINAATTG